MLPTAEWQYCSAVLSLVEAFSAFNICLFWVHLVSMCIIYIKNWQGLTLYSPKASVKKRNLVTNEIKEIAKDCLKNLFGYDKAIY